MPASTQMPASAAFHSFRSRVMRVLLFSLLFVQACAQDGYLLRSLNALSLALSYMESHLNEMNLDAVAGVRAVEEQISAMLLFEPEVFQDVRQWLELLQEKADGIAKQGRIVLAKKDPVYAEELGFLMDESLVLLWYPNRFTSVAFTEEPVDCTDDFFNGARSDFCFSELSHDGGTGLSRCGVSDMCVKAKTERNQRGYSLTHQVMYWQLMEKFQCINSGGMEELQIQLCSNVMRDANLTEVAHYPQSHMDLFMEQIGFCGIWGFADFHRTEWLEKILQMQKPSGCYADYSNYNCRDSDKFRYSDRKVRVKRTELVLSDGCLAHKTAVAVTALAALIRFEAEKIYLQMEKTRQTSEY